MYFLTDPEKKVIFGWSAKCGCSHIKNLFKFLKTGRLPNAKTIHTGTYGELLPDISGYTVILVLRNPFERLVSGFLDKYRPGGPFTKSFPKGLTFNTFVDELVKGDYTRVNQHHFTPQLSEAWADRLKQHDRLVVYDLNGIDYAYMAELYRTVIPAELIAFRGGHENSKSRYTRQNRSNVADLPQTAYEGERPDTAAFYTPENRAKVQAFYAQDFAFYAERGFTLSF